MNLEKALINGNYYGLNGKIGKIETEIRDANKNSSLQIYYKIKDPERLDIIVFHVTEDKSYIKRIIGLPGDMIEY